MTYPVSPSKFESNDYKEDWYDKDFFYSPDGTKEFPNHHCKQTWLASLPFITNYRNAIDIGCRDGEYTRYLHKNFKHVYAFDYRHRKLFSKNVNLENVTHFKCGLGYDNRTIKVSGGGSMTSQKIPIEKWYEEKIFTLDSFNLQDVDYIKIDTDGFELEILIGATSTINKYEPLLVIEEETERTETLEFCSNLGYIIAGWDKLHRNVILRKIK